MRPFDLHDQQTAHHRIVRACVFAAIVAGVAASVLAIAVVTAVG